MKVTTVEPKPKPVDVQITITLKEARILKWVSGRNITLPNAFDEDEPDSHTFHRNELFGLKFRIDN